jgi:hypothetical protein
MRQTESNQRERERERERDRERQREAYIQTQTLTARMSLPENKDVRCPKPPNGEPIPKGENGDAENTSSSKRLSL